MKFICLSCCHSSPAAARRGHSGSRALSLAACAALAAAVTPSGAAITGTVFRDFDSNGTKVATEPGISGVTVRAFNASNVEVATATTGASGDYSLSGVTGSVRVEVSGFPAHFKPGVSAAAKPLVFVAADGATAQNVALQNPSDYSDAESDLATPCYVNGDPVPPGSGAAGMPWLVRVPYDPVAVVGLNDYLATGEVIGATWGLAWQRSTRTLFSAAVLKRHSGTGTGGIDAIYRTVETAGVPVSTLFLKLGDYGISAGTDPRVSGDLTTVPTTPNHDAGAFDAVGKKGLGDMDISEDEQTLWVVNLQNRSLVEIPVGNPPAAPAAGTLTEHALPASVTPAVTNGTLRPWALGVKDGFVYVGAVTTAEAAGGTAGNLQAYILRHDPAGADGNFTQVSTFALNYPRASVSDDDSTATLSAGATSAAWRPWIDDWSDITAPAPGAATWSQTIHPQPMLTDIEFDTDGSMILGFADRFGFQVGNYNYSPVSTDTATYEGTVAGDMLRLFKTTTGYELESNATAPAGASNAGTSTGGAGSVPGQGPGNGEWYWQDMFAVSANKDEGSHCEITLGGLASRFGSGGIASTCFDPVYDFRAGGLSWFGHSTGLRTDSYQIFGVDEGGQPVTFGKSSGLGDLEVLTGPVPLQIGDLVWNDANSNGRQDPGESGIGSVNLQLWEDTDGDGTVDTMTGQTTSSASGAYLFGGAGNTGMLDRGLGPVRTAGATIAQSADDAEQLGTTVTLNGTTLDLPRDGTTAQTTGLRYCLPIPQAATITSASIQFTGNAADSGVANMLIRAQNTNNAAAFTTAASNISSRTLTSASVAWSPPDWAMTGGLPGISSPAQKTPDLSPLVQAVVNRAGWASGNCMAFIVTNGAGTASTRRAFSFDGVNNRAPALVVHYRTTEKYRIMSGRKYEVRIAGGQTPLAALAATPVNADASQRDSNAVLTGTTHYSVLTTAAGSNDHTVDFGFAAATAPAALGNLVFFDANNDGLRDADGADNTVGTGDDEPGIAGVQVSLFFANDSTPVDDPNTAGIQNYVSTTDSNGLYSFTGLAPGGYRVQISTPPAGKPNSSSFTDTADNQQDNDDNGIQTVSGGTVSSPVILLGAGETDNTVDFGFAGPWLSLGSMVWCDTNANSTYEAGTDTPVTGVKLELWSPGLNGVPGGGDDLRLRTITTATLSPDKNFEFTELTPGSYYIRVSPVNFVSGPGALSGCSLAVTPVSLDNGVDNDSNGLQSAGYGSVVLSPVITLDGNEPGSGGTGMTDDTIDFGFMPAPPAVVRCYAVADEGNPDVAFSNDGTGWVRIGGATANTGVNGIEAIAYNPFTDVLYACDNNTLGTIDLSTGDFTPVAGTIGAVDGALGTLTISDIDGMAWDPHLNVLWATERREASGTQLDLLLRIDVVTGLAIQDAFGPGVDYAAVPAITDTSTGSLVYDVDDIAVDPATGELFAMQNQGGAGGMLTVLNKTDGTVARVVGSIAPLGDIEALGFYNNGVLYASTGNNAPNNADKNRFFLVDKQTAVLTEIGPIDPTGDELDFEAVDCLSGDPNLITGRITYDANCSGVADAGDSGTSICVRLYRDLNQNGMVDAGEPQLQEVQADGSGNYSISLAATGAFVVRPCVEQLPAGHYLIGATQRAVFFPGVGMTSPNNDFVHAINPNTIAGTVFEDTDNNGTGDTPLSGAVLTLCSDPNGDGNPADGVILTNPVSGVPWTITTGGDGTYAFDCLPDGCYVVKVSAGYLVSSADSTADGASPADPATSDIASLAACVTGGETDNGNDFVVEMPGSITGRIFEDTDGDDDGDAPINVVTLTLCLDANGDGVAEGPADDPNTVLPDDYIITTTNGTYAFTGLRPGSYVVKQTQPSGFLNVVDTDSIADDSGSPGDAANVPLDNEIAVTIAGRETDSGNDFIEEQPAAISGTIYADTNNDNAGDAVINVVTLTLCTDLNHDGDSDDAGEGPVDADPLTAGVQDYIITTTNGTYAFTGLASGSYVVKETQPENYLTVTDLDSAPDILTSPADAPVTSTLDNLISVTVAPGETDAGNDFVEEQPAVISGTVYADTNNDNIGDTVINVVTLTLCTDLNHDGDSDDAGEGPVDADPLTAGVQDYIFTTTDGTYAFTGLASGSYVVKETQPENYLTVSDLDSDPDILTSPADAPVISTVDNLISVTVAAGETDAGNDFVEEQIATILGAIYADTDNNDTGDEPINVVIVTLCTDLNGDGDSDDAGEGPVDSDPLTAGVQDYIITTTDGTYAFTGLTPGSYVVKETQPSGFVTVTDLDSAEDDAGSPVDAANTSGADNVIPVNVAAGETDSGNDFVERMVVGVGNLVYIDLDGDQVFTALIDRPVAGVTVNAYADANADGDPDNSVIQGNATTDSSGIYLIDGLLPGRYVLHIPSGEFTTGELSGTVSVPGAGGDNGVDDSADENGVDAADPALTGVFSASVELMPGTEPSALEGETGAASGSDDLRENAIDLTVDFAFKGQRLIAGQVRYDGDQDGDLEDLDSPLEGFTVTLYLDTDGNGAIDAPQDISLASQTTGTDGTYSFDCLPDGDFLVSVRPPDLVIRNTNDRDLDNNRLIPVVLAGEDSLDNDFLETVDPQGWFYDVETCQVVPDGLVEVTSMPAGGAVTYVKTGADGEYAWLTNGVGGTYTMTLTLPPGYILAPQPEYQPQSGPYDAPAGPGTVTLGSGLDITGTMLADCSGAGNIWYLSFILNAGDQSVIHNNIPLIRSKPVTFAGWQALNTLGGENDPADNPEGDAWENLEEFAYCFNPRSGVRECALEVIVRPDGTIAACQRRAAGLIGVSFSLAYIEDLTDSGPNGIGWTILSDAPTSINDNGDGTETACWEDVETLTGLTGGQGFLSSVVASDLDQSGDTFHPSETAWSPVLGWMDHTLEVGCETISLPFEGCPVVEAEVAAGDSGSLDISAALNGITLDALLASGTSYYVEVTRGWQEGQRFEIDETASTGTAVILDAAGEYNTLALLPDLTGARIAIREFKTLGAQFPVQDYFAGTGASTADYVLVFEGGEWVTYYLLDLDDLTTGDEVWVRAGAGLADQGGKLLDPSLGMFVHRRQTAMTQTQTGMVRENRFACPLPAGCSLVSNPWPVGASVLDRDMLDYTASSATPFTGGLSASRGDQVLLWTGDATPGAASYEVHFYARTSTRNYYTAGGDSSLPNQNSLDLFLPLHSQCLCLQAAHADYIMPLPWAPPDAPSLIPQN